MRWAKSLTGAFRSYAVVSVLTAFEDNEKAVELDPGLASQEVGQLCV